MENKKEPIIGMLLGDHAGSSPELVVKVLLAKDTPYTAVIIGNRHRFEMSRAVVPDGDSLHIVDWDGTSRPQLLDAPRTAYFYDVPAGPDISYGRITFDSGKIQYDHIAAGIRLERSGMVDGLLMAPITKAAFHAADLDFSTEFQLFGKLYGQNEDAASVVYSGEYFRSTVVGHCPFCEIMNNLSTERVIATGHRLLHMMTYFMEPEQCHIAIAALNPHAGENGLFGNEETTLLQPAIDHLRAEGYHVEGPWPCDTAINRVKSGQANGIVYLYHDQGNIAQKAAEFGGLMLIYINIPGVIVSVGHGPAYGKAGKGTADPANLIASSKILYQIVKKRINA